MARDHKLPKRLPHILAIGEAPGETEDAKGVPFYGRSGYILNTIYSYAESSFLVTTTNTVCCRPTYNPDTTPKAALWGKNRQPEESEMNLCVSHVEELLISYQFSGVLILGEVADSYYRKHNFDSHHTLNLLHPAFIARKDYKLNTIRLEARKLKTWLQKVPVKKYSLNS